MKVLVAYASQHGATGGIAERIAERLRGAGHRVEALSVTAARDISPYDAFVVGSAVYIGHWQKEALGFVRGNAASLRERPTWLFSSGPLGESRLDDQGRDKREAAVPEEIPELRELVGPRGHQVFFGALNPDDLPIIPRLMRLLPAGRKLLEEGDFRDWAGIEVWADGIARALEPPGATVGSGQRTGEGRGLESWRSSSRCPEEASTRWKTSGSSSRRSGWRGC